MNTGPNSSRSAVAGRKDKLVTDLKGVVADADDLLKEMVDSSAEEFAAARTKIEGKLGDARSRLADARSAVTGKARVATDATFEYITENPWKVLGVASATGVILGILLSRRPDRSRGAGPG